MTTDQPATDPAETGRTATPCRVSGGLDQPIIAFPTIGHLTADEAHAHLSTVRYLLSLVERDTRNRTGR